MTTTQITVRLPDDLVRYLDQQVADGDVGSRAAAVARALRTDQRRRTAERDAEIYASGAADPELDAWTAWSTAHPPLVG